MNEIFVANWSVGGIAGKNILRKMHGEQSDRVNTIQLFVYIKQFFLNVLALYVNILFYLLSLFEKIKQQKVKRFPV